MSTQGLTESEALAENAKREIENIAREAKDKAKLTIAGAVERLQLERERIINQMRQETLYS
jgi:F0F1-type ATP synthase membrane subunit b/b'